MLHQNLVKALQKKGLTIEFFNNGWYRARSTNYTIQWWARYHDQEISDIAIMRNKELYDENLNIQIPVNRPNSIKEAISMLDNLEFDIKGETNDTKNVN